MLLADHSWCAHARQITACETTLTISA